jgi:AraC family transcriptional regulator
VHGAIERVPSGCPGSWASGSAEESLGIILAPELVPPVAGQTARTSPARVASRSPFRPRDPWIAPIGLALFAERREDRVDGRLLAASAAHRPAVPRLRHDAPHTSRVRESSGGLSRRERRRVREVLHAHLENGLQVAELAATLGGGPYHFARLFTRSTGRTPHQSVITGRIERAKPVLAHAESSSAEIASRVGVARQRHVTPHFRTRLATTPHAHGGRLPCRGARTSQG